MTAAAAVIRDRVGRRRPRIALVLGSGLGPLADAAEDAVAVPYAALPGWPAPGVSGHGGMLVAGRIADREVLLLRGRAHFYEHGRADAMRPVIETLAALGTGTLLLTNAAGSLRPEHGPGSVVLIADHLFWGGLNPLIGDAGDERFVDMRDAYDPALRAAFRRAAAAQDMPLPEGVYMFFSGPSFETPAEIRAARLLGADLVGMSTVPEVILARRHGLRVAALSAVTNLGAGLSDERLSHAHTQAQATRARDGLTAVLNGALGEIA